MKKDPCPKCGSTEIIASAVVRDNERRSFNALGVFVKYPKNQQSPGKLEEGSELRAWVCGHCGYTEIYATNFKVLLAAKKSGKT